jgi:surface protein
LETPGDLSSWNISNVISMSFMFNQCYNLQTIGDISNWKFNNLTRIDKSFYDCRELKSLGDISKWNVSTINIVAMMFYNCKKLIADCSKWKFKNTISKNSIKSAFLKTNTKKLLRPNII